MVRELHVLGAAGVLGLAAMWPLGGARPAAVGGLRKPLPKLAAIVSKERFAHPERGAYAHGHDH